MSTRSRDLAVTAIAPAIWGSTYIVTTTFLPDHSPIAVALLRALPAGLLLLVVVRRLPTRGWWLRTFVLGGLNIALFLPLLFVATYRLPGGVAATLGAIQPILVVFLAALLIRVPVRPAAVAGGVVGLAGVAALVLTPSATLDGVGVAAGVAGAASMALGTVLTRRWQPPVDLLTFTAWQLTAGGLLLVPIAWLVGTPISVPEGSSLLALGWLGIVGAALAYAIWFRGIARLPPAAVAALGFLSPATAVLLGWTLAGETLTLLQGVGFGLVFASIGIMGRDSAAPQTRKAAAAG